MLYPPSAVVLSAIVFGCAVFAQAYIIDDSDSTIQYSPAQSWTHFANSSNVDNDQVFNATYSESYCKTNEGCHIKIPFEGSGITIYNVVFAEVNASFAIDGGIPHSYINQSLPCIRTDCNNMTIFNVQSLTYGNHILDISTFSWNHDSSYFDFDYADVKGADPSGVSTIPLMVTSSTVAITSPSAIHISSSVTFTSPSSTTTSLNHSSRKMSAAAIGGVFGGLAGGAAIVLALLCLRQRKRSQRTMDLDPEHSVSLNGPPIRNAWWRRYRKSSISLIPVGFPKQEQTTRPSPEFVPNSRMRSKMTIPATYMVTQPAPPTPPSPSNEAAASVRTLSTPTPALTVENPPGTGYGLNDMQADTIHRLLKQNVPAPIVATVMESMFTGEGPSSGGDNSIVASTESEAPPRYNPQR